MTAAEKSLSVCEESLSKERSQGALLKQRHAATSAELESVTAKWQAAVSDVTTLTAKEASTSADLGATKSKVRPLCGQLLWVHVWRPPLGFAHTRTRLHAAALSHAPMGKHAPRPPPPMCIRAHKH